MDAESAKNAWIQEQAARVAAELPLVAPGADPEIVRASMAERASVVAQSAAVLALGLAAAESNVGMVWQLLMSWSELPQALRWPSLRAFGGGLETVGRTVRNATVTVEQRLAIIDAVEATARAELAVPADAIPESLRRVLLRFLGPLMAAVRTKTASDAKVDLFEVLGPLFGEIVGSVTREERRPCACGIRAMSHLDSADFSLVDANDNDAELFRLTGAGCRALASGFAGHLVREAVVDMVLKGTFDDSASQLLLAAALPNDDVLRARNAFKLAGVEMFYLTVAGARVLRGGGLRADHFRRDVARVIDEMAAPGVRVQEPGRQPEGYENALSDGPASAGVEGKVPGRPAGRSQMGSLPTTAGRPGSPYGADRQAPPIAPQPRLSCPAEPPSGMVVAGELRCELMVGHEGPHWGAQGTVSWEAPGHEGPHARSPSGYLARAMKGDGAGAGVYVAPRGTPGVTDETEEGGPK